MVEQNISTLDQGEDALALSSAPENHGIFRDNGSCVMGFAKPTTSSSGEPGPWYSLGLLRGHAMASFLDLRPDTYLDSPAYQRPATEQLLARLSEWYSELWLGTSTQAEVEGWRSEARCAGHVATYQSTAPRFQEVLYWKLAL